jgi:hypothetical protein
MTPQEFLAAGPETFEIHFHKDLRLASVASLLKCAHLTLFAMLGYRYALSRGGRFLGKTILGTFFDENLGLEKAQIQANGTSHFLQFANMVRPIVSFPNTLRETVADRSVHICMTDSEIPWAMVVYLRTAEHWHAVLVPVMDTPEGSSTFIDFLNSGGSLIRAQHAQLHNDRWMLSGTDFELNWVVAGWP